jgi:hypothetical protein
MAPHFRHSTRVQPRAIPRWRPLNSEIIPARESGARNLYDSSELFLISEKTIGSDAAKIERKKAATFPAYDHRNL